MPKLLVFAPCEKVIVSQDENNPTLIAILTSLTLQADDEALRKAVGEGSPGEESLPLVPMRWSVFSLWQSQPSDEGKEFTQTVEVESPEPERKVIITHRNTFKFNPDASTHRINLTFPGFPVRVRGWYIIRILLDGNAVAEYPIELKLAPLKPTGKS